MMIKNQGDQKSLRKIWEKNLNTLVNKNVALVGNGNFYVDPLSLLSLAFFT